MTILVRNPVIGRVFRELNLIEQWGSGVRRMFKEAAVLGLAPLEIIEIGMRLRFTIPLSKLLILKQSEARAQSDAILRALSHAALSAQEFADILGLKSKTGALKRSIKELVKQCLLTYTIPDKPSSRLQKYCLTKEGQAMIGESE